MPVDKQFPPIGSDPYGTQITEWAGSVVRSIADLESGMIPNTPAGRSALIASPEMAAALGSSGGGGGNMEFVTPERWAEIQPGLPGILYIVSSSAPTTDPGFVWPIRADFLGPATVPTATDTGQAWRIESGAWTQAEGSLWGAADGAFVVADFLSRTQTVEVEITGTVYASSGPTLIVRNDPVTDHHYRIVKVNTSEIRVERRDPSSTVVLQSPTGVVPAAAPYRIRVAITGEPGAVYIRLWVNDIEVVEKTQGVAAYSPGQGWLDTDPTPPNGTEAGFRMGFTGSGGAYRFSKYRGARAIILPTAA